MDTRSLQTFITIADKRSFSDAADALFLTQPAVSKRVIALENELGVRLFDRIGRQVQLTEAGKLFHRRAKSVLQLLDDTVTQIDNLSGKVSGKLRLGTSHHIGLHHLPPVLHHFSKQYPEVDLELAFMDSESACDSVLAGELETAVITLPDVPKGLLHSIPLWRDKLEIVIAGDHASAAALQSKKISTLQKFEILQSIPAVLPQPGTYTRRIIEREFQKRHLKIQDRLPTNYLETIKMMVQVGLGWSVLPDTLLTHKMCRIELQGVQLKRRLGIIWHERRTLTNAAAKLVATLENEHGEQH